MALRSPAYLDVETLLAQAEYHDVSVAHPADIVEKTVRRRTGGGRIGITQVGVNGSVGSDVEYQSSYSLEPRQKATMSKVIDDLQAMGAVTIDPCGETTLTRDLLVEIEGRMRVTAASLAGKVFYLLRRFLDQSGVEALIVDDDFDPTDDPVVVEQMKRIYLQNELVPVPVLLELEGTSLPQKVYVSLRPQFFIDAASTSSLSGEFRVLGTVRRLIPGGPEGFLSAEEWLLHDWEYLLKRHMMLRIDTVVAELVEGLELDLPAGDVHAYLTGPAIVIDAIAVY